MPPEERTEKCAQYKARRGPKPARVSLPGELRRGAGDVYGLYIDGEIIYVGQAEHFDSKGMRHGASRRLSQHFDDAIKPDGGDCTKLNNKIRKYGAKAIELRVLMVVPDAKRLVQDDMTMLDYHEVAATVEYDTIRNGCNLRLGGKTGPASEQTRRLMSELRKGDRHPCSASTTRRRPAARSSSTTSTGPCASTETA